MDLGIKGKWALVCGASKGLGLGCAQALVREGVHVVIVARGAPLLEAAAADLRALPADIANHARLRFHHGRRYNVLQKLAYAGVLFGLLPLMILTGLTMSPGFNARAPFLLDLFGGRQTARTLHFVTMVER